MPPRLGLFSMNMEACRLGELEISITPRAVGFDPAAAARFADLGVHRLIVRPPRGLQPAALEDWVRATGERQTR